MSRPQSSSATALTAILVGVVACGGAVLLHYSNGYFELWPNVVGPPRSEGGGRSVVPGSSREVEALMQGLQRTQHELGQAIETWPASAKNATPNEAHTLKQLVRNMVERSDEILARGDVSNVHRKRARRAKLNALCKGAVHLPNQFASEADAYCHQVVEECPGTEEAAEALGYLLALKYLVEERDVDDVARRELTQYARDYPSSDFAVVLFHKVSQRLTGSRRTEAIRLARLGIKACAGHSNVHRLHEQLALLEGRPNRNRPITTRVSGRSGSHSPWKQEEYPSEPSRLLGMPMAIRGPLLRGGFVNVGAYRNKVVLVDFWATWCGPCRKEMPTIRRLNNKYRNDGLVVVGVSLDTDRDKLNDFVLSNDLNWPQIFVAPRGDVGWDNPIAQTYDVESIPKTFLVNRRGKIVAVGLRGKDLEHAIRSELAK